MSVKFQAGELGIPAVWPSYVLCIPQVMAGVRILRATGSPRRLNPIPSHFRKTFSNSGWGREEGRAPFTPKSWTFNTPANIPLFPGPTRAPSVMGKDCELS